MTREVAQSYINNNHTQKLIETFEKVKDTNCPTVVHIHTLKGCGYKKAEENKEFCHFIMPHDLDSDCKYNYSNYYNYYNYIS